MKVFNDLLAAAALFWPLTLLLLIGLTFLVVIPLAVKYAKRNGRSKWRWGIGAFLLVYLPIFWDWIPTVATHQFYCAKDSGFWVYKTLDQWKAENPGVMETLVANKVWPHQRIDDKDVAIINQRVRLVYAERNELFLHRWPDIRELVDSKSNEVLARYVDFSTSQERGHAGWSGWKFWLHNESCVSGRGKAIEFGKYYLQFKGSEK